MKFEIEALELQFQKPTKVKGITFEIFPSFCEYIVIFRADETTDDDNMIWEERITNVKITALRKAVSGLEREYMENSNTWKVQLNMIGFTNDIKIFFKKESDADNLYQQLQKWLTSNTICE